VTAGFGKIVAAFCLCLHEIGANILVPRMMEERVGVSSDGLIIALLVGFELLERWQRWLNVNPE
jgi:hypothetical protein